MNAIQGVPVSSSMKPLQAPLLQPMRRDRDGDGGADRAGAVERDKGTLMDVQA